MAWAPIPTRPFFARAMQQSSPSADGGPPASHVRPTYGRCCWEKSAHAAGQSVSAFDLFEDLLVMHMVRGEVVARVRIDHRKSLSLTPTDSSSRNAFFLKQCSCYRRQSRFNRLGFCASTTSGANKREPTDIESSIWGRLKVVLQEERSPGHPCATFTTECLTTNEGTLAFLPNSNVAEIGGRKKVIAEILL